MARNLNQVQIDRRKRHGAIMTRTSSAIGLGSLAVLGASKGRSKYAGKGLLKAVDKEKATNLHEKTKDGLFSLGVVGSGIAGLNGFNNASWQSAEARQRKAATTVAKSAFEDGFYGSTYDVEEISKIGLPTAAIAGVKRGFSGVKAVESIKNPAYRAGFGVGSAAGKVKAAGVGGSLKAIGGYAKTNAKPLGIGAGAGAVAGASLMKKPKIPTAPTAPGQFGKSASSPFGVVHD